MEPKHTLLLGCIADDFTGASDAASFLAGQGLRVILLNGIPSAGAQPFPSGADAVVVALKTRNIPPQEAVALTGQAEAFLRRQGAEHLYLKYCSTFDSTPKGNIGPVADAALERLNLPYTLLCPSLPVNGRTVRDGVLYVNGQPLAESSMRDHPLNPMWDSRISELMKPQSKYPCVVWEGEKLTWPEGRVRQALEALQREHPHFYLVPDYETSAQGERIAAQFGHLPLLTGGSGLLEHLARQSGASPAGAAALPRRTVRGRSLLLSGSCSVATREQLRRYEASGGTLLCLSPHTLLTDPGCLDDIWLHVLEQPDVLVRSAPQNPCDTKAEQTRFSAALEAGFAALGKRALEAGFTQFIVAGGETSGAVMQALGFQSFWIGENVAPGVPVLIPTQAPDLRLVLKSGNFGQPEFFLDALRMTQQ